MSNGVRSKRTGGGLLVVLLAATALLLAPPGAEAARRAVVKVRTVAVGAVGNPSVGIVPFTDAIYQSCADAPDSSGGCLTVGGVDYRYGIGQLEITVDQWVKFLNTIDPKGRDRHHLYAPTQSAARWPKYGAVDKSRHARKGHRYAVASPEWADKPYGFASFLSAARFVNSLFNGRLLAKTKRASGDGTRITVYKVRLSPKTGRGMYDLAQDKDGGATRARKRGFVVPSQDEWIKAAYYDPSGGGQYSYWKYPTNAGTFGGGSGDAPSPTTLDPTTGDVTNPGSAADPVAGFHDSSAPAPSWCPPSFTADECSSVNPFGIDPTTYAKLFQGSMETVGQARTPSPWGTLDQGGNAVEWTDTITPSPSGKGNRVWRRLHGGIANAPAYQLWLSAVGLQPEDNAFFTHTYPWLGFRVGVVGNLKVKG